MSEPANIYRYRFMQDPFGYVVYRHFDGLTCSRDEAVRAHKEAVFVAQDAAADYCQYRNRLIDERGTDELFTAYCAKCGGAMPLPAEPTDPKAWFIHAACPSAVER